MPKKSNAKRADGRIAVQVYLGKDETGRRKYKTVYGKTQKEADKAAALVREKLRKGMTVSDDRKNTFECYSQRWLKVKQIDVGVSQMRVYECCLKHLQPLYPIPVSQIKMQMIQDIILNLAENNPNTGKPAARKTLNEIRNTARQVFQYALDNRDIEYNPADSVRIPKTAVKKKRRALSDIEIKRIAEMPHHMQTAAMIMLYAGLRRGELIPLTWEDIDLEHGAIRVDKAVDLTRGKPISKPPKTEAGNRTVIIPNVLTEYLKRIENKSGLVVSAAHGQMFTATSWKKHWDSYMLDMEISYGDVPGRKSKFDPKRAIIKTLEPITPHILRHTACTMMIEAGMDPATVQRQMGHASIQTTLEIYTHISQSHSKDQIEKMNDYIKQKKKNASQRCKSNIENR